MSTPQTGKLPRDKTRLTYLLHDVLTELGLDLKDPNFVGSPKRMAEWLLEFTTPQKDIINTCGVHGMATFPHDRTALLTIEPFTVFSVCPHHFLPVEYKVTVGYIPSGKVIGLSKIIRITDTFAKQPILQEEFSPGLADLLSKVLCTEHVAVRAKGIHFCMRMRGVKNGNGATNTALLGAFKTDPALRSEFYEIANGA